MNAATQPDISVKLAGLELKNPVMVASGTFGYGREYADLVDLNGLGAIMVKGILMEPWEGNRTPRMVEVRGGLINAIGLQNPGVEYFIKEELPFLRQYDVPVIVNVWGRTIDEYAQVCARLDSEPGVAALELNVSCPNVKHGGLAFGADPAMLAQVVKAARDVTKLPLIPKLSPQLFAIGEFAKVAEANGADAVSLTNTLPAMVIDVETRRPVLANKIGGLSGPAIHPVAVKLVRDAACAVKIPVIGMGGIENAADALEFIIAGASAVAVGTANFSEPQTALQVVDGIREYMQRHGFDSLAGLTGSLNME